MEKKIIMYDSPEAAREVTLTGWISSTNQFWGKDEHMARWAGCTHLKCECGSTMEKSYTRCPECRHKSAVERYNALPFKEWDYKEPVCTWDGDTYFFNIEDLDEYMEDSELKEIDLLFCDEINYSPIDYDYWGSDAHEDWEPPSALKERLMEFNNFIKTLPAHSYTPGKTRTNYKFQP
jgi:hypothetical protein